VTRGDRETERKKIKKVSSEREQGSAYYIRRPLLHNAINPCVPSFNEVTGTSSTGTKINSSAGS